MSDSPNVPNIYKETVFIHECLFDVSMSMQATLHHKRNLEVRFRPEDSYCKPAIAKETKVTTVTLYMANRV